MTVTIKWHAPPRHADEVWATAAYMLRKKLTFADIRIEEVPHNVSAVIRDPKKEVWIDVGGIHDPALSCFDHHGNGVDHCAFFLVAQALGETALVSSALMTRVETWDLTGYLGAAKKLGFRNPSNDEEFPFDHMEKYMIRQIERGKYEYLTHFVDALEYYLAARRLKLERIEFLRQNTEFIALPVKEWMDIVYQRKMHNAPEMTSAEKAYLDSEIRVLFLPTSLGESQIVGLADVAKEGKCHLKLAPDMSDPRKWTLIRTNRGRMHGIDLTRLPALNAELFQYAHPAGHLARTSAGIAPKRILNFIEKSDIGFKCFAVDPNAPVEDLDDDVPVVMDEPPADKSQIPLSAEDEELFEGMTKGRIPGSGGR